MKLVAPARGLPEEALKLLRDASMRAAAARERPEAALRLGRDPFKLVVATREGPEDASVRFGGRICGIDAWTAWKPGRICVCPEPSWCRRRLVPPSGAAAVPAFRHGVGRRREAVPDNGREALPRKCSSARE